MLSRFHLIPERHGQTDGQNCYINIARQCGDLKCGNHLELSENIRNCSHFVVFLELYIPGSLSRILMFESY